jgi:tetratricopeptide (TPR) repeat protein
MGRYGSEDQYLERMLLYFIRTDSLAETLPLQAHFLSSKRRKISSATLSELGGYFLDKKTAVTEGVPDRNLSRIENIKELLQEAVRRDAKNPEAYYHLTRYFERFGKPAEEKRAAERAIEAFAAAPESSAKRASYRIDAHRRLASLLVKEKEFLSAEERLLEGIRLYEDALARRLLGRKQEFGRLYADLGDIEYFKAGDLDAAVDNYQEAERNGWAPPEIRYRVGYAAYARENWGDAVESLFKAASESPLNRRILFALGNSLYRRGDLHAAQGYYNRLLDLLETERSRFPVLLPNERPDHADLAERLMRARNNLGVTLEDLAERTGDSRYKSRALALYSESARAWDALTREPATMVRSGSTNLAFLNTRGSLYPDRRFEPQIYAEIDKDGLEPSTWEELLSE